MRLQDRAFDVAGDDETAADDPVDELEAGATLARVNEQDFRLLLQGLEIRRKDAFMARIVESSFDGILTVELPKREEAKPKSIPIGIGSAKQISATKK